MEQVRARSNFGALAQSESNQLSKMAEMVSEKEARAPYSSAELESVEERFREKVPRPARGVLLAKRLRGCARYDAGIQGQ